MPLPRLATSGPQGEPLKHEPPPPSPHRDRSRAGLPLVEAASKRLLRMLPGVCLMTCGFLAAEEAPTPQAVARAIRDGANFRHPARSYVAMPGPWQLHVEKPLVDQQPERARRAVAKLAAALAFVFRTLPEQSATLLKPLNFYLLWGKESPDGGRDSGMSYIRKGEPDRHPHLDPRWEHAIIVYSADNLLYLDDLWTRKALMHELAHAWHLSHWPEKHPPIHDAWLHSQDQQLYRNVRDSKGGVIATAYACKNQLEYFAELSAMYFVGGNYHPFDRQGLQTYDPVGHAMVERVWGLPH